ncbi:MAG: hypothetical protein R3F43_04525 [bacterium]
MPRPAAGGGRAGSQPLGLADRIVGVESARCAGRLLVDPEDPERSLMLALVDPVRYAAAGQSCALGLMPPGSAGLPAEGIACLESYLRDISATVEPPPPPTPPSMARWPR